MAVNRLNGTSPDRHLLELSAEQRQKSSKQKTHEFKAIDTGKSSPDLYSIVKHQQQHIAYSGFQSGIRAIRISAT